MRKLMIVLVGTFSLNSMAIQFITEDQVAKTVGGDKVIEVSKYAFESIIPAGSKCAEAVASRSARAYVVKKGHKASLYLTEEGLDTLNECVAL